MESASLTEEGQELQPLDVLLFMFLENTIQEVLKSFLLSIERLSDNSLHHVLEVLFFSNSSYKSVEVNCLVFTIIILDGLIYSSQLLNCLFS